MLKFNTSSEDFFCLISVFYSNQAFVRKSTLFFSDTLLKGIMQT